ncbi:MAG TPA: Gfo/Idh/MocA family oxidoreductase [Candidatus Limnocylindrales bacterium]|nr:Gfo/Idh/MocA family oxidoreductase [Candidatus Limnocylindrales bacterium]
MTPDGVFGIAVVGSGDMGATYAEVAARHVPAARLVAVGGGRRAAGLAADYGVDHAEPYEDLLARSDVDGVILAIPHSLHVGHAVAAAKARRHVLVEKPMALSTEECDAMILAADGAGVDLSVIMTMRFDGNFRRAHELVGEGAIGQVRMLRLSGLTSGYDMGHKTWIADPAEGGVLLDWGSHAFDILRWFAGADPVRIAAEFAHFSDTAVAEPTAMVQLAYGNGVLAQVWMSYELPDPGLDSAFRLWVVGSRGILEATRFGQLRLGTGGAWQVVAEDGPADWALERRHDPVRLASPVAQVCDWVDSILANRPSSAPARDARWAVRQVEAAYRAWRTGEVVRFDA